MSYKVSSNHKKILADTYTPVGIYLKLRDLFPNTLLLESSDYHSRENAYSYLCLQPIASFQVNNHLAIAEYPDGKSEQTKITNETSVSALLNKFIQQFDTPINNEKFIINGLFGYTTYDAVPYFEDLHFQAEKLDKKDIPDIRYQVFQNVIVFNHFNNEIHLYEHLYGDQQESKLEDLGSLINHQNISVYPFQTTNEESTNMTDEEVLQMIRKGKGHCQKGDVFQIVLSRAFAQKFQGDDFNVYRALRTVNPSPYLFYFDYGDYKIMGSSPEAQLTIRDKVATIHPIAGTYKRTGNDERDLELAGELQKDPKEKAEHVMLVDLARNDLSRSTAAVKVDTFCKIQQFSHVIHMVSKVTGNLTEKSNPVQIVSDTFPAGTLSGAPKHRAMQLIDKYEKERRSFYGGAIGFLGFNGDYNHAIIIRSLLSKNNELHYQAGAGVVVKSDEQKELEEINNKIAAVRKAIKLATTI
ncbi:MAG: anthranilate synthase component 1 [Polaribacter sp.]|jgi:anthranilate synthase component 1